MYDALGSKIDTISETDMMEELEKLAVEEIVAVVKKWNYATMISEEKPVKQPIAHSSPAHRSPAHSSLAHSSTAHRSPAQSSPAHSSPAKQPTAKFKTPALAQALAKMGLHREDTHGRHGPAAGGGAEKVHPSEIPRPEDQQVLAQEDQQVLAPEAQQILAEEKPLDDTVVGLIRGSDPGLQEGGQDPGLQEGGRDPGLQVGGKDPGLQVGGRRPWPTRGGKRSWPTSGRTRTENPRNHPLCRERVHTCCAT
jgi:hypothetical protein